MSKRMRRAPHTELWALYAEDINSTTFTAATDRQKGRTIKRRGVHMQQAPPSTVATETTTQDPPSDTGPTLNFLDLEPVNEPVDVDMEDVVLDEEGDELSSKKIPRFVTLEHDKVLLQWTPERQHFLDEILRLEGRRGQTDETCPTCPPDSAEVPKYRCVDCSNVRLVCRSCCVENHLHNPFHRVREWNGRFFQYTTLATMGLIIQLGHPPHEICYNPVAATRDFVVLHTNGFHPVSIQYCQCTQMAQAGNHIDQLLRFELFPATLTYPSTCCTFRLLEQFHILTLQSKISGYDFYLALERFTDNSGTLKKPERLKAFIRSVREWRHLKLLKRAGRGHIPNGVANIGKGELAVQCPACPRPGFNLPSNWESVADDLKYLYSLFIAIDANFRLRRRARSSEERDPALGSGLAYFVEDNEYRQYILDRTDEAEFSSCTGFAALTQAHTKNLKGYATTGVALAVCARHGIILPNGVADLQKGERYCNVDYVVASALHLIGQLPGLVITYDIACQWSIHFLERLQAFPDHLRIEIPDNLDLRFGIPKYHFNGHKEEGHNIYSLNLMVGVGRTDGEEVERNWSRHDGTAASSREQGPGSRHDNLDDDFNWANYLKYTTLGPSLHRRQLLNTHERRRHEEAFIAFCSELTPANVLKWITMAKDFERDPKNAVDPYFIAPSGLTEADIRLQLAVEDEQAATATGDQPLHDITPSSMLVTLLELEDQQRRFLAKYPRSATYTPNRTAQAVEKRNALRRRITNIREVQALYMPCVPSIVAQYQVERRQKVQQQLNRASANIQLTDDYLNPPEEQPLFLPFALSTDDLDQCSPGLAEMECRLREGQLRNSLDQLRIQLHIKSRLVNFKNKNIRHQVQNTRARQQLATNESKIKALAAKYRAARTAKLVLSGRGAWEHEWQVLEQKDIHCMVVASGREADDDEPEESEGRRTVSWIWMSADREGGNAQDISGMNDALRVEFLRTRARFLRFNEEVNILQEEKRRTLVSLEKEALVWDEREGEVLKWETCPILRLGLAAYAAEQSAIRRRLASNFRDLWLEPCTPSSGQGDTAQQNDDGGVLLFGDGSGSSDEDGMGNEDDTDTEI